ncbi:uncharacterized protein PHALS_05067 [Plasmopara halstedii]|uniref:Uncharacterized protein n=1 Tax=Plasmopara halstedii TaxID=4781 RepID=A0A0P1A9L6_PLAHL|nr:uncharacterized protein PHALS_05067 [Plasmopara halstedii]CEG37476.1 hypothetical protein PHALS_05067 [Plasmopara halstedii]|eukprot:XP_024573845.1 hypothetical protein PHALS_05067 [Plasmopara halstedii]
MVTITSLLRDKKIKNNNNEQSLSSLDGNLSSHFVWIVWKMRRTMLKNSCKFFLLEFNKDDEFVSQFFDFVGKPFSKCDNGEYQQLVVLQENEGKHVRW